MSRFAKKLFNAKKQLLNKEKKFAEYDRNVINDHKNDIDLLKLSMLDKFKNEYYKKSDDILQIMYDTNIDVLPGGTRIIKFYNNHGYKRDATCYIINCRVDIHLELEKTFPGIYSKFSGKQVLISCLNDRNPIIKFYISRNDLRKALYNMEQKNNNKGKIHSYRSK